jgi:hypothetical protein
MKNHIAFLIASALRLFIRSYGDSIQPTGGSRAKIKTKILSWSAFLIIGIGFTAFGQPQVLQMDDGTKLTLLGTTFGTHHMAPGYENLRTANWIYSPSNTTMVWIEAEHKMNQRPIFELLVSDRANTGCVNIEQSYPGTQVKAGMDIYGFTLTAYPRWDQDTILRVKPYGSGGKRGISWNLDGYGGTVVKGEFALTNSTIGAPAQWTPEQLPATKSDGDLEVTLNKLVAGAPMPSWEGGSLVPTNDVVNQCVHLNFDFRQNGQSTTNWYPGPVQTTDASGNWSRGLIYPYPTNGITRIWGRMINGSNIPRPEHYEMDGYCYQPGLWPNQPWKVRLEFIKRSSFNDDEIVTFTNLPVRPGSQRDADYEWTWNASNTNLTFIAQGKANDVQLKILPPLLVVNRWNSSQKNITVIIHTNPGFKPKGMNMTVVSATDDQGRDVWALGSPSWAGHYSVDFGNVRNDVKSLNLKLALHKSRFVEFTVMPTKQ